MPVTDAGESRVELARPEPSAGAETLIATHLAFGGRLGSDGGRSLTVRGASEFGRRAVRRGFFVAGGSKT